MIDTTVQRIIQDGDKLFSERLPLLSLWQDIAYNFYPQRADFLYQRYIGFDFMSNLTTNYPVAAREELGNAISSLLRPANTAWFSMQSDGTDNDGKGWLQNASRKMRRTLYGAETCFVKAAKQADHDFITFGQAVLTLDFDRASGNILFRNRHLRDTVWSENNAGVVDTVHRKIEITASNLVRMFGKEAVSPKVIKLLDKEPHRKIKCRHAVFPADDYPSLMPTTGKNKPFVSVYVDTEHEYIMEKNGLRRMPYIIPRWQTVSGSQYAWSPCVVMALADARLMQAMMETILEAGEKSTNPPMVATEEAVRSEMAVYAGGVTWVDAQYDERLGPALRPIQQDYRGLPNGLEISQDVRAQMHSAFFLNKLMLPPFDPKMTAFATGEMIKEYIRQAQPLIEPIENEYSAPLCEAAFNFMMDKGFFADTPMPPSLSGAEYEFGFTSPITQAIDAQKVGQLQQLQGIIAGAAQIDPDVTALVDLKAAARDAANGIEVPATWLVGEQQVQQILAQKQAQAQAMQQMQAVHAAGQVGEQVGKAGQALGGAGMLPPEMMQAQ